MPTTCADCGRHFTPNRADARYCSPACRQRAYRTRNATPVTPTSNGSSVTDGVVEELRSEIARLQAENDRLKAETTTRNAHCVTPTRNGSSVTDTDLRKRVKELETELKQVKRDYTAGAKQLKKQAQDEIKRLELEVIEWKTNFFAAQSKLGSAGAREAEARRIIGNKTIFTKDDFNTIRSCLHPDTASNPDGERAVSAEKLTKAFRLFNENEKYLTKHD